MRRTGASAVDGGGVGHTAGVVCLLAAPLFRAARALFGNGVEAAVRGARSAGGRRRGEDKQRPRDGEEHVKAGAKLPFPNFNIFRAGK